MAQQKRGLGRGLGALIPTAPGPTGLGRPAGETAGASLSGFATVTSERPEVDGPYFDEIAIGAITPNPRQPRQNFDDDALDELAASIREVGLLQPVVVRKVMPGRFELVMGERRWRACQRAGLEHVPAIVRGTPDDELLREALRRTCTGSSSTPWTKPPHISNSSMTSRPRTTSLRARSGGLGRTSQIRSGCSSSRRPCSAGSRRAC